MNSTFSLTRTLWLIRKLVTEVRIDFLQLLAITFILNTILFNGFLSLADNVDRIYDKVRLVTFIISLCLGGSLYLYRISKRLQEKDRQIDDFRLPNSILEKCFVNVLHSLIILITALGVFYFSDWLTILVSSSELISTEVSNFSLFNSPVSFIYIGFLLFFFICCILGYIQHTIDNKIKGTIFSFMWFGCFYGLNILLNIIFLKEVSPTTFFTLPFMDVRLKNSFSHFGDYVITSGITNTQVQLYFFAPIIALIILIYFFRLKENEI